jgi:hypothetical protein
MAADMPYMPTDVQLLHGYLGKRLETAGDNVSLDDALTGFQEYYSQLRDLRGKVRQAERSLDQGNGNPLDVEAIVGRVRKRLTEKGIVG